MAAKPKGYKKDSPIKVVMIVTIALVLVMVLLYLLMNQSGNKTFDSAPPLENQPVLGNEEASVSVVEFGDYKCPGCGTWATEIFPQLEADYIESGDVSFSFYNYLGFGQESFLASLASRTVYEEAPEEFWEFHQRLFEVAPSEEVTMELLLDLLAEHAPSVEEETFMQALEEETYLSSLEQELAVVQQYEVNATPTIVINETLVEDPFDYDEIQALIDDQLAE